MHHDSAGPDRPVDMETDGPLLDDVNMLKKTVVEEATEVRRSPELCVCVCVIDYISEPYRIPPLVRSKKSNVESAR